MDTTNHGDENQDCFDRVRRKCCLVIGICRCSAVKTIIAECRWLLGLALRNPTTTA